MLTCCDDDGVGWLLTRDFLADVSQSFFVSAVIKYKFWRLSDSALHSFRGHRERERWRVKHSVVNYWFCHSGNLSLPTLRGWRKKKSKRNICFTCQRDLCLDFHLVPVAPGASDYQWTDVHWCSRIWCNIIIFRFQQQTFHSPLRVRSGSFYFNFRIN